MLPDSIAEKIANAAPSNGGNIIRDGKYLFAVRKLIAEKKFDGHMFIAEFKVLESSQVLPDVTPNAVGTTCSFVLNLDKNISAVGNVKAFVLALLGYANDAVSSADFIATLHQITGAGQPARGMVIGDETFRKPIRGGTNAGKMFTSHRWATVAQKPEDIAARRAQMDAAGE